MILRSRQIVNEHGNRISFVVKESEDGITIWAAGPDSTVEHTWTPREADTIRELIDEIRGSEARRDVKKGDA